MEKNIVISEYEELLKARRFYIDGKRQLYDFTFEKIKKGLGTEYLENINEKIERWIDITIVENFLKTRPVEYYILVKMLYRDGFYESAKELRLKECTKLLLFYLHYFIRY